MLPGPVCTALFTSTSTSAPLVENPLGGAHQRGPVEEVGLDRHRPTARCFDLERGGLEASGNGLTAGGAGLVDRVALSDGASGDGDIEALRRQSDGRRLADPAARAGHQGDASGFRHEQAQ